jgi:hypothetical protein
MTNIVHDERTAELFLLRLNLDTARSLLAQKQQEAYNIEANVAAMERRIAELTEDLAVPVMENPCRAGGAAPI